MTIATSILSGQGNIKTQAKRDDAARRAVRDDFGVTNQYEYMRYWFADNSSIEARFCPDNGFKGLYEV